MATKQSPWCCALVLIQGPINHHGVRAERWRVSHRTHFAVSCSPSSKICTTRWSICQRPHNEMIRPIIVTGCSFGVLCWHWGFIGTGSEFPSSSKLRMHLSAFPLVFVTFQAGQLLCQCPSPSAFTDTITTSLETTLRRFFVVLLTFLFLLICLDPWIRRANN